MHLFRARRAAAAVLALIIAVGAAPAARAQTVPLRVNLDCQNTGCDRDYFNTALAFVTFVRDQGDADVQVLVTSQDNGSGGETYTLRLIGRGALAGRTDEITVPFGATATDDDERRGIAQAMSASLVGFAARAGRLGGLTLTVAVPTGGGGPASVASERDPWNRWVYSARVSANFNGDSNYGSRSLRANASATRTTERWKTRLSAYGNTNLDRYRLSDSTFDRQTRRSRGGSFLGALATGPRTTLGARASVSSSPDYDNTDLASRVSVGAEVNRFPYSENTARTLTARYEVAAQANDYRDTTLYDKTREVLFEHELTLSASFQQPWGTVGASTSIEQFLNHPGQYGINTVVSADVRLYKGLSLNIGGYVNLTRNQRAILRGKASDADVYTRRRALASGYNFFGGGGLRYTFGSKLSGAVNPRYEGGQNFNFYF